MGTKAEKKIQKAQKKSIEGSKFWRMCSKLTPLETKIWEQYIVSPVITTREQLAEFYTRLVFLRKTWKDTHHESWDSDEKILGFLSDDIDAKVSMSALADPDYIRRLLSDLAGLLEDAYCLSLCAQPCPPSMECRPSN